MWCSFTSLITKNYTVKKNRTLHDMWWIFVRVIEKVVCDEMKDWLLHVI